LSRPVAELLELQGGMLRVAFQQGELLIRACTYVLRERAVIVPKIRIGAV
jgi:hypothetical protein